MQPQALPGFRDFYPTELALRSHVFRIWREVAARYGFVEYDGPPLEPLELYTAKSGDEIVGQLYNFTDKGDRAVALRPEMTPTLARMVSARANGLRKPIRWFSIPQLFRYERQQRGRLREHFQLNCDLIGEPGPLGDAEIVALAVDMMRAFGLGPADVRVRLSDRRLLTALLSARGVPEAGMAEAYQYIDKVERLRGGEIEEFRSRAAERIQPATVLDLTDIAGIRGWPALEEELRRRPAAAEAAQPLRRVCEALDQMGLGEFLDLDLTIVRGLAYYTGMVFELFDAARSLRAICGGGRYDTLLESLGGTSLPALGFGMGDVVLTELLRDRGVVPPEPPPVDVIVAAVTADDMPHVLAVAHELRDANIRVEFALGSQPLRKQLDLANARHARWAVVIGPDDRVRGDVMLKDLTGKGQSAVRREELVARLSEWSKETRWPT